MGEGEGEDHGVEQSRFWKRRKQVNQLCRHCEVFYLGMFAENVNTRHTKYNKLLSIFKNWEILVFIQRRIIFNIICQGRSLRLDVMSWRLGGLPQVILWSSVVKWPQSEPSPQWTHLCSLQGVVWRTWCLGGHFVTLVSDSQPLSSPF